ncbi:MAG: SLC13 family permease [Planctomycetes bacterium]|nr:SLC13 family permease [Planctomycetota bacterium]MBI3848492.1 SLC13 family permease [Planctomycetota bacterium]
MADYVALAAIVATALYFFWTQKLRTDVTALLVTLSLVVPWPHSIHGDWRSILTTTEGFSGFGSPAVVMVTSMFVFGGAMVRTGAAEGVGGKVFRLCARNELLLQAAVLVTTTIFSMFINDTTVVLVFLPIILAVCKEKNLSPTRYLLCAAYGSLLGGQWTLIGTRSNIVISDYLRSRTGAGLGFFDLTAVAAVVFVGCVIWFLGWGRKFLPRATPDDDAERKLAREYLTEVMVTPKSGTIGKTLGELPWSNRSDLAVLMVIRGESRLPAHGWLSLEPGDVLVVQGPVPTIGDLLKSPDFQLKAELEINRQTLQSVDLVTVEAIVPLHSDYVGRSLDDVDFCEAYGFSVMGISRHGRTIRERPMATPLEFSDSLLMLGHKSSLERLRRNSSLIVIGDQPFPAVGKQKALVTLALLLGVILTTSLGVLSAAVSIPLAAMIAILLGCIKIKDAYESVDWQAVVTVAGMIPFGVALEKSGAADRLAHAIASGLSGIGTTATMGALLLATVGLTQIIENAAVAIITAPIAFELAKSAGADPRPFMVGLAICVSSAFCTPVAHESTILVMGPGRYEFKHYLRVGGVMAILTWLTATLVSPIVWPY